VSHPPYHLRVNKAVDRLALLEAIRRIESVWDLSDYTYYGFGGPCLEEFRLLYELFPCLSMVSIERDEQTYKRQQFHLPCTMLKLLNTDFSSFLAQYESRDRKSIFWLDYTGLDYRCFEDFMALLGGVAAGSMIKITLRSEPRDYVGKEEEFQKRFGAVMPDTLAAPPPTLVDFAGLLQNMLQIAAEKALSGAASTAFMPVSSFCYSDGTGMLTLTGVACAADEESMVRAAFKGWQLANLDWKRPRWIDVPILSTKERLFLEGLLPCSGRPGRVLRRALGYHVGADQKTTEARLKQYADFHRYSPYFMRATP
jgi:hypothetical protein